MAKIRTSRGFGSAAFLLLAAGAHAQQCDLAELQSHLAAVQSECCFDDSISDLQENLVAVRPRAAFLLVCVLACRIELEFRCHDKP